MRISRQHRLGIDEAKARLDDLAEELGRELSLTHLWRGDNQDFHDIGVDGTISVTESSINVALQLGFALMFVEAKIRRTIESALAHHVGTDKH